ncbi:NADP-dependent phosphogluconate dehydrogenase [Jannaschia aquimarina]|uniref:6-phosphogluconate dehydrogenase, decarboxylating n=1 Tax=Jannaschia aquimarina TaxID=935700 RepID=A0A0D1EKI5_9RHOB|nr:NADP-dependent phosphogluconate dehydrogenase [Jannaschia aquimarina]KIT17536.1 6-phosphogluconate dehydrogenase, NADP(+)-dependent, decarboxylating [Jannaschia aquimarina]SNS73459.1 6-phosphogluconate dehydrogenase (decarboxylating) [Jannaschia aquimarina]
MGARIGLIGLGTMGAALASNIAEKGFDIAVFNRTTKVTRDFVDGAGDLADRMTACESLEDFVAAIDAPRAIILMVPAGEPVDQQIEALRPLLDADDLIIDCGNANFHDTNRRMTESGGPFLGVGVSGGEEGARHGPAIMGGGEPGHWDRVADIMNAIAAKHEGEPCAGLLGPDGAGHFVKMVHNGIEYADMQMIAEIYGILRDGHGLSPDEIATVFEAWDKGPLKSYLIEITGKVARAADTATGKPLLDVIVDAAGQKGTGRWTAIESQHLLTPIPAIEAAVVARNVSSRRDERAAGQEMFGAAPQAVEIDRDTLEQALIAGKVLCYAQGFVMIAATCEAHGWDVDLPTVARIWREGCIIRSAMLDDMASALADHPGDNLMRTPHFAEMLKSTHDALRQVVSQAALAGHSVPALSSGLAYFDAMRTARGTANMIQAQRDFFGLHGFVHVDGREDVHGPWAGKDAGKQG